MARPDPHEGKYPAQPARVVEPGTPEHAAWVADMAARRTAAEHRFRARGSEIGRPVHWGRG